MRQVIASHLCIAVDWQQFCKESRNVKRELYLNVTISFFYQCLLSCRYVMFQKQYFKYTEMERHKQSLGGAFPPPFSPPVATALF